MNKGFYLSTLSSVLFLSACGGGSSDSPPDDGNTSNPPPTNYTVSAEAGDGGSITPSTVTVTEGDTTSFTVTPEDAYSIGTVSGCGGSLDGNTYTTGSITSDCTVEATFVAASYTVTTQMNLYGEISPESQEVSHGDTAEFSVTPNEGYAITEVTGCNGSLAESTYTTGPVTEACEVSASFEEVESTTLDAPTNLSAVTRSTSIEYSWNAVADAETYHLFYDTEPNIDPDNYAATGTGVMVDNVSSPYTAENLDRETTYYAVVVAAAGDIESQPSNEVSATLDGEPTNTELSDTGQTACVGQDPEKEFNNAIVVDCDTAEIRVQDAMVGRDALALKGELEKVGVGHAGFDFTKIGSDGQPLAIQDQPFQKETGSESDGTRWSCARDNHTGLLWEVKSPLDSEEERNPNSYDAMYSWYNSELAEYGWSTGVMNGGSDCGGIRCDTEAFLEYANSTKLCGHTGWRLPNKKEIRSIEVFSSGRIDPSNLIFWSRWFYEDGFYPGPILGVGFKLPAADQPFRVSVGPSYFYDPTLQPAFVRLVTDDLEEK